MRPLIQLHIAEDDIVGKKALSQLEQVIQQDVLSISQQPMTPEERISSLQSYFAQLKRSLTTPQDETKKLRQQSFGLISQGKEASADEARELTRRLLLNILRRRIQQPERKSAQPVQEPEKSKTLELVEKVPETVELHRWRTRVYESLGKVTYDAKEHLQKRHLYGFSEQLDSPSLRKNTLLRAKALMCPARGELSADFMALLEPSVPDRFSELVRRTTNENDLMILNTILEAVAEQGIVTAYQLESVDPQKDARQVGLSQYKLVTRRQLNKFRSACLQFVKEQYGMTSLKQLPSIGDASLGIVDPLLSTQGVLDGNIPDAWLDVATANTIVLHKALKEGMIDVSKKTKWLLNPGLSVCFYTRGNKKMTDDVRVVARRQP